MVLPEVSIVLCTRNRASRLSDALAYYEKIATNILWDLVIVDNGSTDETQQMLRNFSGRDILFFINIFYEPRKGASYARNTGWQKANGKIIVFVDDDCYPQADFVDQIWKNFSETRLDYLGGKVLLYDPSDYPITIQLRDTRLILPPGSFIPAGLIHSANLAVQREVLQTLGGFDEMLGAGTPFSCEDVDLISRASAAGFVGVYDPRPVVFHHHRRRSDEEVKNLMRSYDLGRGAYYMKCILDPARRKEAIKNWYWSLRDGVIRSFSSPQIAMKIIYEFRGAVHYLIYRYLYSLKS